MPTDRKPGTIAGIPTRTLLIGGAVGGAAFLVYRYIKGRSAGASTALTGGTTIPAGGTTTSTSATPATLAAWQQQALQYGTNPFDMLNAITNWLAGNCVDQSGYSGLTQAVQQLGLPPGLTTFPVLTVCANGNPAGSSSGSGAGGTSGGGSGGSGASAGGGSTAPTPNLPAATVMPIPASPNGTLVPTVGSSGETLPGNVNANPPGAVALPAPVTNDFAGTQAVVAAAHLTPGGPGGVLPNGLRVRAVQETPGGPIVNEYY